MERPASNINENFSLQDTERVDVLKTAGRQTPTRRLDELFPQYYAGHEPTKYRNCNPYSVTGEEIASMSQDEIWDVWLAMRLTELWAQGQALIDSARRNERDRMNS